MASRRSLQKVTRQTWLSIGLRRKIVEQFGRDTSGTFETGLYGHRYRGRFDSYIDREVFFFGEYDRGTLTLLRLLAAQRREPVLLDIGGNVGQHTLAMARHYSAIHTFEPFPPLVAALRNHVGINGLRHVTVHAIGLGDVDAVASYAAPADERAGSGGFDNPDPNLKRFELQMRRGDTYFAERGITHADVIKIDVEGSERRVIDGLRDFLAKSRPALIFEYLPDAWRDGFEGALPPDYRVWKLLEKNSFMKVFARERLLLVDTSSLLDGDTVVALPAEWKPPAGVIVERRRRPRVAP
jgi:FkbM family methyltransferase